jgi:glycerol-3-phosphate dehydrogenase (NAD+)
LFALITKLQGLEAIASHGVGIVEGFGDVAMEGTADSNPLANKHGEDMKTKDELRLRELRELLEKFDGDLLRVVGVGTGAWRSVFIAILQDTYDTFRDAI